MKTFAEIERTIRENREKINDAKEAAAIGVVAAERQRRKSDDPAIAAALAESELLQIENKILHDNARRAYFAEVIPAVVAEFQKYKGKAYGEKTKQKISDACKAAAGCAAYLTGGAWYETQKLTIVPLDANGFSGTGMFRYRDLDCCIAAKDDKGNHGKLLDDNKIQEFSADDLDLCYSVRYVDDARARAELIKIQFAEVQAAYRAYEAAASAYNKLLPGGMEDVNSNGRPRYSIL